MKIIILAAGSGNRFQSEEAALKELPKALLPIDSSTSLFDLHLKNLVHIVPLKKISVVIGFKKELFIQKYPFLNFIENPFYESENTAKSLLRALQAIGDSEDVLWMNGDVLCKEQAFLSFFSSLTNFSSSLVTKKKVDEEAVKFQTKKNLITHISKEIKEAEGESLGVNFFKKQDLPFFIDSLQKCLETDYFEKAMELSIEKGIAITPFYCAPNDCVEIDFWEDFLHAKEIWKEEC